MAALLAFAAFAYGPYLGMPFVGDDYAFLDETMWASFPELWSLRNTTFGWYRPWSRELHFWAIQHVAGPSPGIFRLAGLSLWLTTLILFRLFTGKFLSRTESWFATIGVASLSLWGTPLLWVSGSQELWMLALGLCYLLLVANRRDYLALPALLLALLSKETAAVFPGIGFAYTLLISRDGWAKSLRRVVPAAAVIVVWAWLHPTLLTRLTVPLAGDPEVLDRPSQLIVTLKNFLACFNCSTVPRPNDLSLEAVAFTGISAALLVTALWLAPPLHAPGVSLSSRPSRNRLLVFTAVWAGLGWIPTHMPSIGWHAYYGSVGTLAVWAAVAFLARGRRAIFFPAIAAMAVLRGADAMTPSADWGSEWYLLRAGSLLSAIEAKMRILRPSMEPHTRVFLARIPNNIGLVAGRSAAIRVWYRDSTLAGDFYSNYRPREDGRVRGPDLFFRFDTLQVLVEVVAGPEDVRRAAATNAGWADDHEKLAMLFLGARQPSLAAAQFEKISILPDHPEAALYAGASRELAGQAQRADSLYASYSRRSGLSPDSVRYLANALVRSAPGSGLGPLPVPATARYGHRSLEDLLPRADIRAWAP